MGIMADRLDAMHVAATSPDGQLAGELRGDGEVRLSFRGDTYRHYTERSLERQLSRLTLRIWTAYQREYDAVVAEVSGTPAKSGRQTWDANRRRFRQAQAETTSTGFSANGWIYAETTGMTDWQFVIRDGALAALAEEEFVGEAISAYRAMHHDYLAKMTALRAEHYGVSFQPRLSLVKENRT